MEIERRISDELVSVTNSGDCFWSVSNDQLKGTTPLEAALVQQYVNFADQEILPAAATWVFPTLGLMQQNKQVGFADDTQIDSGESFK